MKKYTELERALMLFGIKKEDTKHIVKFLKLAKNKL
jgi:hypothetical protein